MKHHSEHGPSSTGGELLPPVWKLPLDADSLRGTKATKSLLGPPYCPEQRVDLKANNPVFRTIPCQPKPA